jgi:hypothetical protein
LPAGAWECVVGTSWFLLFLFPLLLWRGVRNNTKAILGDRPIFRKSIAVASFAEKLCGVDSSR